MHWKWQSLLMCLSSFARLNSQSAIVLSYCQTTRTLTLRPAVPTKMDVHRCCWQLIDGVVCDSLYVGSVNLSYSVYQPHELNIIYHQSIINHLLSGLFNWIIAGSFLVVKNPSWTLYKSSSWNTLLNGWSKVQVLITEEFTDVIL